MSTLYLKYRPSTFDEVIGQEHVTDILKAELLSGKISHAYLFVGPRGTGKTSTARILAKAINCTKLDSSGNPCNKCNICSLASNGKLLDIIEIDAASNRRIDEIRALKEKIEYRPSLGKYKVYIIDEVHMLTKEAFNALLKTLEEPPEHVVFILATTEPHKVPITIASRCERFEFRLGTFEELSKVALDVAKKEGVSIDPEALKVIVEHAAGSYRDLLSLLDSLFSKSSEGGNLTYEIVKQALGLPDETMIYYFISSVFAKEESKTFDMLDEIFQRGINLDQFLKGVIVKLRDLAIAFRTNEDLDKTGYGFVRNFSAKDILHFISLLLRAQGQLKNTFDVKLPIQLAVLEMVNYLQGDEKVRVILEKRDRDYNGKKNVGKKGLESHIEASQTNDKDVSIKKEASSQMPSVEPEETSLPKKEQRGEEPNKESSKQSNLELTMDIINEKWHEFIEQLKPYNGHLYAFLLRAKPVDLLFDSEFKAYTLQVDVKYKFHKERIELATSQQAIREVGDKIFNTGIRIVANVNPELVNEVLGDTAKNFSSSKNSSVATSAPKIEKKQKASHENQVEKTTVSHVRNTASSRQTTEHKTKPKSESFKSVEEDFEDIFSDAVEL